MRTASATSAAKGICKGHSRALRRTLNALQRPASGSSSGILTFTGPPVLNLTLEERSGRLNYGIHFALLNYGIHFALTLPRYGKTRGNRGIDR